MNILRKSGPPSPWQDTFLLDISAKKKKIKKRAQLLHAALSEKLKNGLFVENSQILWPGKITPSNSVLDCPAL